MALSEEQKAQLAIMTSPTSTREEKIAATQLYTDMVNMERAAADPEEFMGGMGEVTEAVVEKKSNIPRRAECTNYK